MAYIPSLFSLIRLPSRIVRKESRDYASVRKKFQDMAVKGSLPTPQSAENMRADAIHKKIILKQQAGAIPNSAAQEKSSSLSGPVVFRNISPPAQDEGRLSGHKRPSEAPEGLSAILRKILHDPQKSRNSSGIAMTSSQSPSPPTSHASKTASLPISEIHEVLTDILGSSERLDDLLEGFESQFAGVQDVQRAIQGLFLALRGFLDHNRPQPAQQSAQSASSSKRTKTEDNGRVHHQQEGERLFFELNNNHNAQHHSNHHGEGGSSEQNNHFDDEQDADNVEGDDERSGGDMDVAVTENHSNGHGHGSYSHVSSNGHNAFDEDD